jgi:Flp pilus assembly protein TadD
MLWHHRLLPSCLSALLLAQVLACATATPQSLARGWIEVRSEHFTLASRIGELETVELAEQLELFRSLVERITRIQRIDSPVPTYIYLFDGPASFQPFRGGRRILGYFSGQMRANYVALMKSPDMDLASMMYHEYTHFLVRNGSALAYPKWFSEGFAEFMGAVGVVDGRIMVGDIPDDRVQQLFHTRWIPIEKVLNAEHYHRWSSDNQSMFYLESWALVHYLMFGGEHEEFFSDRMTSYLTLLIGGASQDGAFEEAFGISPRELDRRLQKYLKGDLKGYSIAVSEFPSGGPPSVRPLPAEEIASQLGVLSLLRDRPEQARGYFEAALALDSAHARALAGLGRVDQLQRRWEEAESSFRRALEVDPDEALGHLDFAEYWHDRAAASEDPAEQARLLRTARRHYVKSYQLDRDNPETYANYGVTFLAPGEQAEKGIETLEYAHQLLPSQSEISVELARAYMKTGRPEDARPLLRSVVVRSHTGDAADTARGLLAAIDGEEAHSEASGEM